MALTVNQVRMLKIVEKRDWPAGEPRRSWLHATSAKTLFCMGLISERPNTEGGLHHSCIVDLTDLGREALANL